MSDPVREMVNDIQEMAYEVHEAVIMTPWSKQSPDNMNSSIVANLFSSAYLMAGNYPPDNSKPNATIKNPNHQTDYWYTRETKQFKELVNIAANLANRRA